MADSAFGSQASGQWRMPRGSGSPDSRSRHGRSQTLGAVPGRRSEGDDQTV